LRSRRRAGVRRGVAATLLGVAPPDLGVRAKTGEADASDAAAPPPRPPRRSGVRAGAGERGGVDAIATTKK